MKYIRGNRLVEKDKNDKMKDCVNNTISFYNKHTEIFIDNTINIDFIAIQRCFLSRLKSSSTILDFGCGSGRDTKYFLEQGCQVTAIDGSIELCKAASKYTGIPVKHMLFQELNETDIYDGIWACSSILHLSIPELIDVFHRMAVALKESGIIYTSFKYGTYEGYRNGRYFTDMTEDRFSGLLQKLKELEIEEQWITSDVRPGRSSEKWLNIILHKK